MCNFDIVCSMNVCELIMCIQGQSCYPGLAITMNLWFY